MNTWEEFPVFFFFLRVVFAQCHAPHNHIILLADRLHLCCTSTASTTSLLFPSNCGRIVGVSRGRLVSLTRVSHSHSTFKWLHVYSVHMHSFSCTKVSVFFVFTEPSIKAIWYTVMLTEMLLTMIQCSLLAAWCNSIAFFLKIYYYSCCYWW